MAELEQAECLENLNLLGVLNEITDEEFSFDVPNYTGFPIILHRLFELLDEKECSSRFKDCWPIVSKVERGQFRKISLDWLEEIKKTDFEGLIPEFSPSIYDNPIGNRYVKFLLGFSTFVLAALCQDMDDDDMQFSSVNSVQSTPADSEDASFTSEQEKMDSEELTELLESEAEMMDEFRAETNDQLEYFGQELLNEKEIEQRERQLLCERIQKFAICLKSKNIDITSNETNLIDFAEEVIEKAKTALKQYKVVWDQLSPLFEKGSRFDEVYKLAIEEKSILKGVDVSKKSAGLGCFKDVFLSDGRLDISKLVEAVHQTIDVIQENAEEAGNLDDLAAVSETSGKSISVLTLMHQEQKELADSMNTLVQEMESSIKSMREKIDEINKDREVPAAASWLRPVPTWEELFNSEDSPPELDFTLPDEPKFDCNELCSSAADCISINAALLASATHQLVEDVDVDFTPNDDEQDPIAVVSRTPENDPDALVEAIGTSMTLTEEGDEDEEETMTIVKQPMPTKERKFHVSMSPFSSSLSSVGISSSNSTNISIAKNDGGFDSMLSFDQTSSTSSMQNSSITESQLPPLRRLSMKFQQNTLKIFEDDEDEDEDVKE